MVATDAVTSALIAGIVALVVALIGGTISWLTNRKTLDQERKLSEAKLDHERDTLRKTLDQERKLNDARLDHERDTLRQTFDQERKLSETKLDHERDTLRQTLDQERKLSEAKLDHERERLREETRTEFMAEQAIRDLLDAEKWPLRSFDKIRDRVGGFDGNNGDDLRQLLIRSGAVRFTSKRGTELWGLVSRNRDLIKARGEKHEPK